MSSTVPKKIFIQVESASEQQENMKTSRKSSRMLSTIQKTGSIDKENLVGRQPAFTVKEQLIKKTIDTETTQTPDRKHKIPNSSQETQTSPSLNPSSSSQQKIVAADLTSDEAGEKYWEVIAEKRRVALEESLTENQELYERIASLETELNESNAQLEEARSLVETLTEMLSEAEHETTEEEQSQPDTTK